MIYAIAGLVEDVAFGDNQDDDEKLIIDIDYTKDVEEVFRDLGFAVASNATHPNWKGNEGFGKLLRETITRADGSRLGGRCSWAPDWRLPKTRVPIRFEYDDLNLFVCDIPKLMLVLPNAYYMGSIKHIFKCFPESASLPVAISWINELLEWAKEQVTAKELSTISSDEDTNMLLAQLLHIMTGGEARWTRLDQPLKVADYVEEISKKMQGRLVFAMLPDTYPGHQEALRLELGIGPSHAHIGDIVCSAGVSPDDVRNKWGSSWTRYLLFQETEPSRVARAKPLSSYLSKERNLGVTKYPVLLDWSDFEFEMIGDSFISPIRSFLTLEHRRSNEQPDFQVDRINII